ncbi:hypothetical protein V1514DRAFT_308762 [Lipomyces japonicus]|uniref:uncharacterized protein n=1 Tax=Lipomyces japonicus TaxID=56871 RepID=UPI0034CFAC6B
MPKRSASSPDRDSTPRSKRIQISSDEANGTGQLQPAISTQSPQVNHNAVDVEGNIENYDEDNESELEDHYGSEVLLPDHSAGGDLYLETVDRKRLDFDFEKLCSVSLSNVNVYACLVCGKYFQGRGKSSHAYFHSVDEDHHVFINLLSLKVYVLPESYEVKSTALDDIKYVVNPVFTKAQVAELDKTLVVSYDLFHEPYLPGFVGINNIKYNDYLNVVVQALSHVSPLRNFFMLENFDGRSELAQRFSILIRKIWNPKAFKSHVSPHELLQYVSGISKKRFKFTEQSDPFDFINWFLNNLHVVLGGSKSKPKSSFIQRTFQGKVRVDSQMITARADAGDRLMFETDTKIQQVIMPFMFLSLELPSAPLFQGDLEKNIIPQVSLQTLLEKYNGIKGQELAGHRKRYKIIEAPPFLTFHIKRLIKTNLSEDTNHTIVTFMPNLLDMSPCTSFFFFFFFFFFGFFFFFFF